MILVETQREIEQFLHHEAQLLSECRFRDWLELFTDDVRYWMPTRETSDTGERDVAKEGELALFDDDKKFLAARVERLYGGLAHAEQPRSRTRYFISNFEMEPDGNDVRARYNLLVYQSRLEKTETMYVGCRDDLLRKINGNWRIARRKIVLDHTILPRSITIFF